MCHQLVNRYILVVLSGFVRPLVTGLDFTINPSPRSEPSGFQKTNRVVEFWRMNRKLRAQGLHPLPNADDDSDMRKWCADLRSQRSRDSAGAPQIVKIGPNWRGGGARTVRRTGGTPAKRLRLDIEDAIDVSGPLAGSAALRTGGRGLRCVFPLPCSISEDHTTTVHAPIICHLLGHFLRQGTIDQPNGIQHCLSCRWAAFLHKRDPRR